MKIGNKKLIVIGDRVLIKPVDLNTRTKMGLYLPDTVKAKEEVATGIVIEHGPGIPMADPSAMKNEPWNNAGDVVKYLPIQVEIGDMVIFLKNAAIEVRIDKENYFVVSQQAILVILKDEANPLDSLTNDNSLLI